jgi:hypothetical protein
MTAVIVFRRGDPWRFYSNPCSGKFVNCRKTQRGGVMTKKVFTLISAAVVLVTFCFYRGTSAGDPEEVLAKNIAEGLIAASPIADPADEGALRKAAAKLTQFTLLRDALRNPILWGEHAPVTSYRPEESNLNVFNSYVWRRMYLPLFMFSGDYRIEKQEGLTLLNIDCRFRYALDAGAYPYPFWHSDKKWVSYELATRLIFVFENGKIIASYRSETQDPSRPKITRAWDGRFRWVDDRGKEMPYVALFNYLFTPSNPYVGQLDAAYRALEAEARQYNCAYCHSPSNPANMNPLRLINLPNQALSIRHQIVTSLRDNKMPPGGHNWDREQQNKLIELAKAFAVLGDRALEYDGEPLR